MAEDRGDKSREDLTEEASPHRIEEQRKKGMVSQSKEITSLSVLLACGVTVYAMSPRFALQVTDFMRMAFRADVYGKKNLDYITVVKGMLITVLEKIGYICVPTCLAGFVLGIIASFLQIGVIFSLDPITPDFAKINPMQGLQRLVSLKQLAESARLIFKMTFVLAIAYGLVKTEVLASAHYLFGEPGSFLANLGRVAKGMFTSLIVILVVFAAIDFALQKFEYNKSLRMTKQEAKQENKEREGDPQIRARIRAVQREMARRRMMAAVKKADVLVTNPTHIAVALVYDRVKMGAPKVVAKGADLIAQNMKKIAREAGVPLVENVPLARTLFKTVKINQSIPRSLYQAVAEVLAYVYRLKKREL